jgi:hypothetical protein
MDDRSGLAAILDDLKINKKCKDCDKCSVHDCELVDQNNFVAKKSSSVVSWWFLLQINKTKSIRKYKMEMYSKRV